MLVNAPECQFLTIAVTSNLIVSSVLKLNDWLAIDDVYQTPPPADPVLNTNWVLGLNEALHVIDPVPEVECQVAPSVIAVFNIVFDGY